MLGGHSLIILQYKSAISLLSKTRIGTTPSMVVSFLTLASQSHYMPEQLKPSLIILSLESMDSNYSLQSALNVYIAIVRQKHVDTSLQIVLDLLIVP